MSLHHGRPYLAIPGPSVIPDAVLRAMHRASPNIYEGELIDLTASLIPDLRRVARTDHHVAIYIGNGHAAWEAALANVCSRGDRVLVLATGRFGHGWGEMAAGLRLETEVLDFGNAAAIDPERVAAALRADTDHRIKAVLAVHVDTSTSVKSDIAALGAAMQKTGHPALLMADCIASLGCDRFEMDEWGVDVMVAGCQKGLMTPPGVSFVFFNDRAKAAQGDLASVYWNWGPRSAPEGFYQYWCGTAPTHHLYGLRTALDMLMDEGIEAVWARHAALAGAVWAACETWAEAGTLKLNVQDRDRRSVAVTAIEVGSGQGDALRQWCEHQAGLTLGIGLGREPADRFFRIGHMGHVNAQMIMGALGTIEAGLAATGIPHKAGGVTAAARVIAEAGSNVVGMTQEAMRDCG